VSQAKPKDELKLSLTITPACLKCGTAHRGKDAQPSKAHERDRHSRGSVKVFDMVILNMDID
jgi:hypothetical protein